ncbi:MAG TPA: hypothetical protein VF980_17420 [Thermoanaerobaculia bacterium]
MTRRERIAFWIATLFTAATRVWGLARSPWDWDEMLFSLALRHYDVALHHPHPPGFPLFIATARLFRTFGLTDFRSLQAVNIIAGVLLVPAMVFLCRELGMPFPTSLIAALFLAFFPNVWFFGGTAFSDVPAVVLVVFAIGLLLRGRRSNAAFIGGAITLAIAGAYRPQNLAIGFVPAVIAAWFRLRERRAGTVVIATIAAVAILALSYGAAVAATGGWQRYAEALRAHQEYITATDSFRNPRRPPLHHLLDDFFVRPYHAPFINFCVTALAIISVFASLLRKRIPILIVIAAFSPFCLFAWLSLDHFSASRFSIGYAPMIALLAADGLAVVSFARERIEWIAGIALTLVMFVWTIPAIELPRRKESPPVEAMNWIRAHVDPASSLVEVHEGMGPYAEYFLDRYHVDWTLDGPPAARLDPRPAWYVKEGIAEAGINFTWPRGRAWDVARRRYFEVAVIPLIGRPRFADGWYDEEETRTSAWRWMGSHGTIELPPIAGKSRLRMRLFVPLHVIKPAPDVLVRVNGAVIRVLRPATPFVDFVQDFDAAAAVRVVDIETSRVVNPLRQHLGSDPRDLGVRLDQLEWSGR